MDATPPRQSPSARRLFFALILPEEQRQTVLQARRHLSGVEDKIRWVRPAGLHLTMRFLGACSPVQAEAAVAAGAEMSATAALEVALGGLGVFPGMAEPRVVWAGLTAGAAAVTALHDRLEHALLRRGVVTERERFTPHLTLGRVRQDATPAQRRAIGSAVAAAPWEDYGRFLATHLALMESILERDGARYISVASFPLAARAADEPTPGPSNGCSG